MKTLKPQKSIALSKTDKNHFLRYFLDRQDRRKTSYGYELNDFGYIHFIESSKNEIHLNLSNSIDCYCVSLTLHVSREMIDLFIDYCNEQQYHHGKYWNLLNKLSETKMTIFLHDNHSVRKLGRKYILPYPPYMQAFFRQPYSKQFGSIIFLSDAGQEYSDVYVQFAKGYNGFFKKIDEHIEDISIFHDANGCSDSYSIRWDAILNGKETGEIDEIDGIEEKFSFYEIAVIESFSIMDKVKKFMYSFSEEMGWNDERTSRKKKSLSKKKIYEMFEGMYYWNKDEAEDMAKRKFFIDLIKNQNQMIEDISKVGLLRYVRDTLFSFGVDKNFNIYKTKKYENYIEEPRIDLYAIFIESFIFYHLYKRAIGEYS